MATKTNDKAEKDSKSSTDKKNTKPKDMGIIQDTKDKVKNIVNKFKGKDMKDPDNTPVIKESVLPKPILADGETATTEKAILPNTPTDKSTPTKEKVETKKTKSKFFSDTIHEIKTDIAVFLGGIITVNRGLKIHRVEEKKFLLSGVEQKEGQQEFTPFEVLFPDILAEGDRNALLPDWYTTFQKELDVYESSLKAEAKAQSLIPKPKAGVDAPPPFNEPQVPVTYATTGIADMLSYADMITKQYTESIHFAKYGKTFSPSEVESNLKKETSLYKFALKFDQKNRGWYIDMQQGNNIVRIPAEPTEFLPIL